jgi:hypothetical protein
VCRAHLCLTFLVLAIGGCDDAFEGQGAPPDEVAAVYGVLDGRAARQTVRLEAVRDTPDRPATLPPLTADLLDEATGERTAAVLRVVPTGNGQLARLAEFGLTIAPGRTYRLDVHNAQGHTGSARTTVPEAHRMAVLPPRRDSLRLIQEVMVEGLVRAPASVALRYHVVITLDANRVSGDTASVLLDVPIGDPGPGGWRVAADLRRDAADLIFRLGSPTLERVRVVAITAEVTERSVEWAFATDRDGPNLHRLLGAFSSLGVSRTTFVPDPEVIRAGGLRP